MARKKRNGRRISNEILLNIFSRLPTRDAVRCSALSRHHRRLVGSLAFWLQHRRRHVLAVPRPRIAYMATTSMLPGRLFHEFHVAGECPGGSHDGDLRRLRRPLIDREPHYSSRPRYAGTCNGVVVLAGDSFYSSTTVVLFNPAVTGGEVVVTIHGRLLRCPHHVSGFGYSPSSDHHKLLLAKLQLEDRNNGDEGSYNATEFLTYTFGRASPDQPRCRKVLWRPRGIKITGPSVYLDGKIYLLEDHSRVLAFDVDDDTATVIELPGEHVADERHHAKSELMEMSGRLCVATAGGERSSIALWLLMADEQQWEQRCLLPRYADDKLAGAWDCGGVLLLFFEGLTKKKEPDVILYDTRTAKKASEPLQLHIPRVVAESEQRRSTTHVFCWGYRPTLVSPAMIIGGGGAPPRQRGGDGVVAALNPVLERDVKAGRERTLDTLCFMDFLHHIMRQLPDKSNDVVRECNRSSLPFSMR